MPEPYDLLLTGGEVLDPGGGQRGRLDVAIRGGLIADVGAGLPGDAHQTVDVSGDLVLPGLVDLHTHVYPGAGYWGVDPDPIAWHTGVTTWVDAGSAGAYSVAGLRDFAASRRVRVRALLNIAGQGLSARTGEGVDLANCDPDLAARAIREHRDLLCGVKVRIDRETVGDNGVEPLRRGLIAARECGVPVMVHIGTTPPALADVLELLRPGDILTHCASGLAQPTGPAARAAYARGVLFDIGHGSGAFAFDVAEAQLASGMPPHTISTDLHARSVHGPVFDLPTTMTKLIAAGLPLDEVVASVTIRPATALGLQAGSLAPGSPADVAVFTRIDQPQELTDAHRQTRTVPFRLVNRHTFVGGRRLPAQFAAPPPPWVPLTEGQTTALRERENAFRDLLSTPLVGVDGLAEQFPRDIEES